jgi:hypothetical protein
MGKYSALAAIQLFQTVGIVEPAHLGRRLCPGQPARSTLRVELRVNGRHIEA